MDKWITHEAKQLSTLQHPMPLSHLTTNRVYHRLSDVLQRFLYHIPRGTHEPQIAAVSDVQALW